MVGAASIRPYSTHPAPLLHACALLPPALEPCSSVTCCCLHAAHVEDLSPACLTRLNDLYALYTNVDGGSTENPCIST